MLGPSNLCFANPRTGVILFAPYLFIVSILAGLWDTWDLIEFHAGLGKARQIASGIFILLLFTLTLGAFLGFFGAIARKVGLIKFYRHIAWGHSIGLSAGLVAKLVTSIHKKNEWNDACKDNKEIGDKFSSLDKCEAFFGIHIGVQVAFIAAMLPFLIMTAKLLAALLRNLTGDPSAEAALEQATAPPRASDVGYGARPARTNTVSSFGGDSQRSAKRAPPMGMVPSGYVPSASAYRSQYPNQH